MNHSQISTLLTEGSTLIVLLFFTFLFRSSLDRISPSSISPGSKHSPLSNLNILLSLCSYSGYSIGSIAIIWAVYLLSIGCIIQSVGTTLSPFDRTRAQMQASIMRTREVIESTAPNGQVIYRLIHRSNSDNPVYQRASSSSQGLILHHEGQLGKILLGAQSTKNARFDKRQDVVHRVELDKNKYARHILQLDPSDYSGGAGPHSSPQRNLVQVHVSINGCSTTSSGGTGTLSDVPIRIIPTLSWPSETRFRLSSNLKEIGLILYNLNDNLSWANRIPSSTYKTLLYIIGAKLGCIVIESTLLESVLISPDAKAIWRVGLNLVSQLVGVKFLSDSLLGVSSLEVLQGRYPNWYTDTTPGSARYANHACNMIFHFLLELFVPFIPGLSGWINWICTGSLNLNNLLLLYFALGVKCFSCMGLIFLVGHYYGQTSRSGKIIRGLDLAHSESGFWIWVESGLMVLCSAIEHILKEKFILFCMLKLLHQ